MPDYDAIIIGAGHNGLTCAGYLARAGLKVKVLERRPVVGGAAVTEEFHPGFRNSVYAYAVSLLHPEVIRDLDLHRHGLEIIERPAGTLSLLDGDQLLLSRDAQQARSEVARFSARDADRFGEYEERIGAVALTLRELALNAPPDFGGGWRNALRLLRIGNRLRKLGRAQRIDLAELMTKSLGDYLDSWFESDALKGILGLECAIGNFVDPYQGGTAYVLLHHAFGEVNGRIGAWGHAKGGMGAISQAMAAFAASQGADIETSAPVRQILVRAGRACGVVTGDGETVSARVIAGNLHPQRLLTELLDPALLPTDTRRRIDAYRSHSATFRMNVALAELPRFTGHGRPIIGRFLRGHRNLSVARLHARRLHQRACDGLVATPDHLPMAALHAGSDARARGWPCGEPVLPALPAPPAGWNLLGRRSGTGCRSRHRHRQSLRAEFQVVDPWPSNQVAAGH